MKTQDNATALGSARTATEFLTEYRGDPENERLYRESEIGFDVAERLKAIRKACGLRQADLAERVGCSQSFIAKLEGGGYERLGLSHLRTYIRAMAYDIDVASMFCAIAKPVYNGHSSCGEIQEGFTLQGLLSDRLTDLAIKSWEKTDGLKLASVKLSTVPERKGIGAAA